jgi:DNA invertase Pin-like site-specific DNA recombinase
MQNILLPCTLYVRKSTDREDMQILSIPAQLRELARFAERAGLRVTEELTESRSAREPGRPVFSKLLADIERGKVERVLAWKLDRLARNPIDGGALIHALGQGKLREIVTPEGTYTGTGDSKFMLAIQFGAATKMTDDLSVGVKRGCRELLAEGRLPGAPPLGYLKIRDGMGFKSGAGKVIPDPERSPLLQQFFHDILSGAVSVTVAWQRARDAGLTTRKTAHKSGKPVSLNYMFDLVRNPFYAGLIRYDGETYQGVHEPMITPAQFRTIQRLATRGDAPRPSHHEFAFTGVLRCGECGGERAMVGEQHVKRSGLRFVYYRCGRRRKGLEICRTKPVAERLLLDAATAGLRAITISSEVGHWTLDAIDWWLTERGGEEHAETAALDRQIRELDARLRKLTDALLAGLVADDDYRFRKQELQLELAELRVRAAHPGAQDRDWRAAVKTIVTTGATALERFSTGEPEAQRATLSKVYANSEVVNGIPRFILKNHYLLLKDAPLVHASVPRRYANLPPPSRVLDRHNAKAAPPSRMHAALWRWWTRVKEVRTRWH